MPLTPTQKVTLKNHALANTAVVAAAAGNVTIQSLFQAASLSTGDAIVIADWYSQAASPNYWLWKSSIFESEITRATSPDATTWSWPAYIARTQGERDAWARLFMGGGSGMNPALGNVRTGLADIFSGGPGAGQRTHLLAVCRRLANNVEKVFAVAATGPGNDGGTRGTTTNPDAPVFEGTVSGNDISDVKGVQA